MDLTAGEHLSEIEITPAMVEAGIAAYEASRPGEVSDFRERDVVIAVYEAMCRASAQPSVR